MTPTQVEMVPYDDRRCQLGEGPLWHPLRHQLFWFDIIGKKLLSRQGDKPQSWSFDEQVSAAGWVDRDRLVIASETALLLFNLETGETSRLCHLEADDPSTRSNDGRADPLGGFWIGTMSKSEKKPDGSVYRWYKGELRQLYTGILVTNATCFAPGGRVAYFTDTPTKLVKRVALDADGWPSGEPEVFLDLREANLYADGAVVDALGNVWIAFWGGYKVAAFRPDGSLMREISVPAKQVTCPAFGGKDLKTLFATSAATNISEDLMAQEPHNGCVFSLALDIEGQPDNQVFV
ncbi:Sugar lactone lactonase YvrE [Cohaesibacter sp. ES.047]|uniref:SMP-30/gluconolactonase/LRE family protein n=1 Tax=Cohaesibacter sp. ES.047 TaxID=1798205 RepID=UPI000BC06C81|nr:SMP-30/gluconolactonase/LRE family protein [Cohaesibacter sp. ES.047]SNY94235.1 Sugar lactone lactonase YvrE [Cohaesibacter sp. ES.047]